MTSIHGSAAQARICLAAVLFGLLLSATGEAQEFEFGGTVLLHEGRIMVNEKGSRIGDGTAAGPGRLYMYERGAGGWEQAGILRAPEHEGPDLFGRFIIVDRDRLLVGAPGFDANENGRNDGRVLMYRRSADNWEFDRYLRPESVPPDTPFGLSASLAGDLLVVAAGDSAWVFERGPDGEWTEDGILAPLDPDPVLEAFGWSVHTDGERVIVGALGGLQYVGAGYVFGRDATGVWAQEARLGLTGDEVQRRAALLSFNGAPYVPVRIEGDYAMLGLPGADGGSGTVLLHERRPSGEWVRNGSLSAFDRQPGAGFGASFSVHDGELWIAAPRADLFGAIYAFARDDAGGRFGAARKIGAGPGTDAGDGFGLSMSADGDMAVVGQLWDDASLGSAVVLERRGGRWTETAKLLIPEERRPLATLPEVECGDDGMADQFTCHQVDMLSFLPLDEIGGTDRGIETNDVWGWTDPQTGREYAIVGRTDGTAFIDMSDPAAPAYLGSLPKTPGSLTQSWRDIKVYADHAFVVADNAGEHGMQVFDLTRLRNVGAPVEFGPDTVYEGIASAHNVVINEETATAYAVGSSGGGETCGGGLHMIDISDPKAPSFVGCHAEAGTGRGRTGYTHDAQCVNYHGPDVEHVGREICFGSNETAVVIADVTDRDNPVTLSTADYPAVAYTHQGWLTEDHRYFYQNDELDEMTSVDAAREAGIEPDMEASRTLIWDVSDLDDPVLVKEHFGETFTIDHNLYIVGDLMYQSNYVSGLRVLDISDRESPREVGFFDTVPWDESVTFDGSWSNYPFFASGTIVVSSGKEGVFFLKYRRPELVP
ncbi:MAG: choice-of-anchor B family protein [Gemmatimonadetes bacterium]|nr:choice-of-anchor B family protein [Candidatus Palauibacter rhopaloidicola]